MIFKESELKQKSSEWIEFRSDKLGASEFPIIMGKYPTVWCDDYQLFLRKMGKPYTFTNKHMERGNEFEEIARELVQNYLTDGQNSENVYDRTGGFDLKDPKFEQYTVQYKHFPSIFSSLRS